ncbi:FIG000875: Thioredoxin domain-containing protein EC-YbbN [Bathymodiolus thermophilus thioautotrophic gill symbiont]|jgi:putative thioredoxin|uniref:Thioredoxin n=1 Tax=Bathymodiolus thermophilus thioautotrophic gill symbiont TaxID=2360 RepID=A0A1J5UA87_9GAMM|nr:thioredoxin family protein [Bathymodiolus thermophilus thioautotrophic gill symbiont]AYQ56793.1 Thioredoxin [Bathymodiolus thermophilus thioautotrophic gill symbiont]OIR25774.1 hypothetical protein BGC33_15495 [Bathymodiolus thermophilus thioautotrophic gill symbiont]CAB5495608.1 hypothetical protein THERMOS_322 [Bathymodiolus thermophilus thioautotrophic gill symbiont]CAB5499727.1 hypothetical protein THERMOT_1111 [Bathymodiolus thermophilus thioautotrophic gill symbiont]SHA29482.1 FIG0008
MPNNLISIEVSIDNFQSLVIDKSHDQLVILDISAQWCSPCRALEPILNEVVAAYNKDELLFAKLEAEDENMKIAGRFSVRGFPTVIAFIRGVEVDRFHSVKTHEFLHEFINRNKGKF